MMLSNGGVVSADDAARTRSASSSPVRRPARWPAAGSPAARRGPAAVLRHGRHDRQGVPHRARRAGADEHVRGGPHLPLQEGLRVPGVGAVGRPRRDRRRRRQPRPHRPVRPAQGRPGVGRRRARTGVATAAAAPSRRSPTPTSCSACSTRATSSAATCRSTPAAPSGGRARSPRARPRHRRRPRRASTRSSTRTWPPARMHAVEQGVDLRGVAAAGLRWRRPGARLRRGRAARVDRGWSSRSTPACCRRSARWSRRCASTSPAR